MPIEIDSEIRLFSEEAFHRLAEDVIGAGYGVHNDLGRLMDEAVYKHALRHRCLARGISPARREVKIKVWHGSFRKVYFIDLLFCLGVVVEGKVVEALNMAHHAQILNYLFLTGTQHGLLLNFRPLKVEKQFVSTTLDASTRRQFYVEDLHWEPLGEASLQVRHEFLVLLEDWGAFLQISLYREALVHFLGGPAVALRRIAIHDGNILLGTHEVCLISDKIALALTALTKETSSMLKHLQRFIGYTELTAIQWINMKNHEIQFRTVCR